MSQDVLLYANGVLVDKPWSITEWPQFEKIEQERIFWLASRYFLEEYERTREFGKRTVSTKGNGLRTRIIIELEEEI